MNDFVNIEDMQEYNQFIEEMQKSSNDYEFSLQKMATKIRDTFLSLVAFETYRYDDITGSNVLFIDTLKHMILISYGKDDMNIIEKWKLLERYQRKRCEEDIKLINDKTAIYRKISCRYRRIRISAFGDTCINCDKSTERAMKMNCKCDKYICLVCINNLKKFNVDNLCSLHCPNCNTRVTNFKTVNSEIETLSKLFNVDELEIENDVTESQFLKVPISNEMRKRKRQEPPVQEPIQDRKSVV